MTQSKRISVGSTLIFCDTATSPPIFLSLERYRRLGISYPPLENLWIDKIFGRLPEGTANTSTAISAILALVSVAALAIWGANR